MASVGLIVACGGLYDSWLELVLASLNFLMISLAVEGLRQSLLPAFAIDIFRSITN